MNEVTTFDLLYNALLVLILLVLASWLIMLGAAVVRCLRDGERAAAKQHLSPHGTSPS